jgi:hypothetical protein
MNALRVSRQPRGLVAFVIVAVLMFAIDGSIARSPAIDFKPTLIGGAIAFDLTIGVLFVYWLLVVRPGRASVASMLGVFVVSTIGATRHRARCPRARGFADHKKNGYAGPLYTIMRIALVEAIAVDFVIRIHHPLAANVFLAIDLLTALWVLGLARGVVLRPILVTRDAIQVRNGLQWRLDVPRVQIERIEFGKVSAPPKRARDHLRGAPGRANVLVELRAPLRAVGPYGLTRDIRRVSLVLDDVAGFQRAISDT